MKRLSIILYVILFVAVIGIYFLHFMGNKTSGKGYTSSAMSAPTGGIVYINIDSVIFKFDMFTDRREELMKKQKSAEAELNAKGTEYERGVKDYQDKVNKGLVTRATAAQMEQSLGQQQQEVVSLRDKLQSNLMEEEQVMNRQILEYITKFLADNRADYNYQFIIGKSFGSVILYGDPSLDITQKLLEALNKKYKAEKK
jgi:outer membrane protein